MTATVPTSDEFASLTTLVKTLQTSVDNEAKARSAADVTLAQRVTALEADGPLPPVDPPPVVDPPPPTGGNTTHVATTSELLSALSRNLGPNATIQMDSGGALSPIKLTTAHRGYSGVVEVDLAGRQVNVSGWGFLSWGARDIDFGNFLLGGGSANQYGAITIGQSTNPAPTLRCSWHDFTLLKSVTGPATVKSTNNATAHGVYISKATAPHEDVSIHTFDADGAGGLAAMIHLYDGSGSTGDRRLHVWNGVIRNFAQAVMAYEEGTGSDAGSSDDALLEGLDFRGCGIVLRLPSGSGIVKDCVSSVTLVKTTDNIGSGWFLDPSNSLR